MGNRSARFISTLVASIIAGAPLAAVSQSAPTEPATAAAATDDCLASPKGVAPQGQHWFYRFDRTKQKCWYLRAEGDKAAQTTQPATPAQRTETPSPQHSPQDAHAEFVRQQPVPAGNASTAIQNRGAAMSQPQAAPRAAVSADNNAQQPAVAARWPDNSDTTEPQQAAPAPDAQPAPQAVAAPAPVAIASADAATDKPTESLQMLLLAVGGALALAGLIGSVIYRFAGSGLRFQTADSPRRSHWDDWEPQDEDHERAPWHNELLATAYMQRPRPVDFDLARRQTARPAVIADDRDAIEPQANEPHEARDVETFDERGSAPQLAAIDAYVDGAEIEQSEVEEIWLEPADVEQAVVEETADDDADAVDIDVITKMLERLAKEGPRLNEPGLDAGLDAGPGANLGAGPAGFAQTRRGQPAARA